MQVTVGISERLDPEEAFDWVLVVVRKNQLSGVLPVLAANHATPNVLFLVNNAAGPGELIHALGRERVVLGFPGAGGRREGSVVRYVLAGRMQPTTLGELDGRVTPRLEQIRRVLQEAGLPVEYCPNMEAWLKTHAMLVTPLAGAVYLAGGDIYRLARTRDGLVLIVRAIREGLRTLEQINIPITPAPYKILQWIPEPLLVALLQRRMPSPRAELAIARHANAARDEMCRLMVEVRDLTRSAHLPTPAIDALAEYCDPAVPAMREGQRNLKLDWRGVWAALGVTGGLCAPDAADCLEEAEIIPGRSTFTRSVLLSRRRLRCDSRPLPRTPIYPRPGTPTLAATWRPSTGRASPTPVGPGSRQSPRAGGSRAPAPTAGRHNAWPARNFPAAPPPAAG